MPNNKTFPMSSIRYEFQYFSWDSWSTNHLTLELAEFTDLFQCPTSPGFQFGYICWQHEILYCTTLKESRPQPNQKSASKPNARAQIQTRKKKTWKCSYLIWCLGKPKLSKLREWEMAAPTQSASALYPSYLQGFATHTPNFLLQELRQISGEERRLQRP